VYRVLQNLAMALNFIAGSDIHERCDSAIDTLSTVRAGLTAERSVQQARKLVENLVDPFSKEEKCAVFNTVQEASPGFQLDPSICLSECNQSTIPIRCLGGRAWREKGGTIRC